MDQISPQSLASILVLFLEKTSYKDDEVLPRAELEALYAFTQEHLPENKAIARAMSDYFHATYSFIPLDVRKAVAVYDAFQMVMDDVPEEENDSLDHLCHQLATSEGVSHPAWKEFFRFLPQVFQHYGPYAQTTILRGALEFMQATCLERTLFKGYPESKYPDFLRRMSSQGPVQAVKEFLPIIATVEAELEYYVGTVNDLFSFYKESNNVFERTNYVFTQSACTHRGVSEVLNECLETAVACQTRLLRILTGVGDGRIVRRIQQFFVGYTRYHLACPRYKIAGLCTESGNKDLARFYDMSCQSMGSPVASDLVDNAIMA
ncbi:MAG: hypothetical protein Q9210_000865 [Variospora velana]